MKRKMITVLPIFALSMCMIVGCSGSNSGTRSGGTNSSSTTTQGTSTNSGSSSSKSGSSYKSSSGSYGSSSKNSSTSSDSSDGYGYDPSDPYYSANDHNGDGKINDEEFQDAMNDAVDDLLSGSYSSGGSSSAGYGYDSSDPYYSANDHNGDGKINDQEFQDAMNDAIDDLLAGTYDSGY